MIPALTQIALGIVAGYCSTNWTIGFLGMRRARHRLSVTEHLALEDNMFHNGLCAIVAIGFIGIIASL